MAIIHEQAFAEMFEAAYTEEESLDYASLDDSTSASSSVHLLSLDPYPSLRHELSRSLSTGPDMSGLESLEGAGQADKAWQRILQRMGQQRGCSGSPNASQVVKKGNEDLLQIFIGGAPEAGALQQVASQLGESKEVTSCSKVRGAAAPSAQTLTC